MGCNFIENIIENDLASGKIREVITRFPPEPNGYLHIGHAKSLCLNFGIKEKYRGKCNLRFDDTNPLKEDVEYVESIKEDIKWLGFRWDGEYYASDYFGIMYDCAEMLIKKGLAYVCDYSAEEIKNTRGTLTEAGKDSPWRNRSVEENLALFRGMKEGKYPDGSKVLRAKIDMASKNMNMRDPVLYRILRVEHHHTGNKWIVYPMYDFAHPIEDAVEKITHSICTLEFEDHRPLYDWVTENCEFDPPPRQYEFARLEMTDTIMSKRYLKKLVDDGTVDGWDDPRMPTLSGMRKRGYPAEAIRNFCAAVGVAKANSEVDAALLEHCVREVLDRDSSRMMAVENPLRLVIENLPCDEQIELVKNPKSADLGTYTAILGRELYIEESDFEVDPPPKYHRLVPGGAVRLRGAYIVRYKSHTEKDGKVCEVRCEVVEGSKAGGINAGMKVKGVIHWVNAKNAVRAEFVKYSSLLLPGAGNFDERLNPRSAETAEGFVEPRIEDFEVGDSVQFVRNGYYKLAAKSAGGCKFLRVVDLKDSYNRSPAGGILRKN